MPSEESASSPIRLYIALRPRSTLLLRTRLKITIDWLFFSVIYHSIKLRPGKESFIHHTNGSVVIQQIHRFKQICSQISPFFLESVKKIY